MGEIRFEYEGCALFAMEHGAGRPVVLLHGGLANHASVLRYALPLASHVRLITPDLRGSGRSRFHGALSWALLADDLAALLDHLALDRAVIGGASFGAGVAIAFALRHPARVEALAILMPAFGGEALVPAQAAAMQAMDAAGRRAPDEGIEVLFPLLAALPPDVRDRAREVFATYDPRSVAASTAFMASGALPFRTAELAAITAPALIVPGTDPTHPASVAEHLAAHLPGAAVRAASPEAYAEVLRAWLATG